MKLIKISEIESAIFRLKQGYGIPYKKKTKGLAIESLKMQKKLIEFCNDTSVDEIIVYRKTDEKTEDGKTIYEFVKSEPIETFIAKSRED